MRWTQKCISRTHRNCCIKSFFIRNIHLKESWNHNLSDFSQNAITWKTFIKRRQLCEKRHFSGRFIKQIKAKFLRNYRQPGITYDPIGADLKCKSRIYLYCIYFGWKPHFSNDDFDFPIIAFRKISFISLNVKLVEIDMWVKQAVV